MEQMPRQYVTTHIALIAGVCFCLLGYLFWSGQQTRIPAAAAADRNSPDSIGLVVNKHRPLTEGYVPPDLSAAGGVQLRTEAAAAYLQMTAEAAAAGVGIDAVSGFRSADEQANLHMSYTGSFGAEAADTISARPGYSEHQTGLAIDIANPGGECALEACFADTLAGSWAASNAHRYGFIIRYPDGAEDITGYAYEPWHLRYVGAEEAGDIFRAGITLEEYAGFPSAPGY